jgi:hypothetical protein
MNEMRLTEDEPADLWDVGWMAQLRLACSDFEPLSHVEILIEHGADVNASRRTDLPRATEFCSPCN